MGNSGTLQKRNEIPNRLKLKAAHVKQIINPDISLTDSSWYLSAKFFYRIIEL
jgi:hypothetical protein